MNHQIPLHSIHQHYFGIKFDSSLAATFEMINQITAFKRAEQWCPFWPRSNILAQRSITALASSDIDRRKAYRFSINYPKNVHSVINETCYGK
jgi:hypothetical protein